MTTKFFCFYLQNRLIQTSQTGGQRNGTLTVPQPVIHYFFPDVESGSAPPVQTGKHKELRATLLKPLQVPQQAKRVFLLPEVQLFISIVYASVFLCG